MTQTAWSKLENIRRSLDVYVNAQLAATFAEGDSGIDWEGVPFDDAGKKEWLQPRLLEPARPRALFHRQISTSTDPGHRGQTVIFILNLNIFVRLGLQTDTVRAIRLHQLRDTVLSAFTEHTKIDVTDYAGDSSVLGSLVVDRINLDRQITQPDLSEDLRQHALGVEMRWLERWAA
mgnify:CR=1 FL=1